LDEELVRLYLFIIIAFVVMAVSYAAFANDPNESAPQKGRLLTHPANVPLMFPEHVSCPQHTDHTTTVISEIYEKRNDGNRIFLPVYDLIQ